MAEEPEPSPSRAGKGIGSKLQKKLGPLPVWAWGLAVGGLAFIGFRYWKAKQAAAASSTDTTGATASTADLGAGTNNTPGSNGYQDSGQLTQLQNQLAGLQQQVNGIPAGVSGTTPATTPPGTAGGYTLLPTQAAVQAAISHGASIFSLNNGTYVPWGGKAISSGYGTSAEPPTLYTSAGATSGAGGSASPPAQSGTAPTAGTGGAPVPVTSGPIMSPNAGSYNAANPIV